MQKIEFKDLPDTSTPINSENLNLLQTNVENAIQESNNYSLNETIIGKWINGKNIYRKVINFGALPNNTSKYMAHNISNIEYVVDCYGNAQNSSGSTTKLPSNNGTINTNLYATKEEVRVVTNGDRSSYTVCYITIEYTKTTD